MQDVENNMDQLLRKAAENYGLKDGDSKWDTISARIIYKPSKAHIVKQKGYVKKLFITSLLVLLFLIAGDIFMQRGNHSFHTLAADKFFAGEMNKKDSGERNPAPATETAIINPGEKKTYNTFTEKNTLTSGEQSLSKSYKYINTNTEIAKQQQNESPLSFPENYSLLSKVNALPGSIPFNINTPNASATPATKLNTTVSDKQETVVTATDAKEITSKKQTGFYFGLVAGTSFNLVKYQGVRKPGIDAGLMAGYQLNNKVSIETGLLFTSKSYYSDGKYFSMKKVSATMPQNMQVLSLEGSSQLLQIPLHFKYNLSQKKNNTVYAAAGISSYVLLKEKNNYHTLLNGDEQDIASIYSASSAYIAGTVDIAAGYQFKTRSNANIRIEPFVQIPLKGIGVGTLPVLSTGLHIGFTFPSH